METLRSMAMWILGLSIVYCCGWEIFHGIFVNKKCKEYADGLRTNFTTSEELMQTVRNMNCFLVKQVYYNENEQVEIQGKYGKHRLKLENNVIYAIRDKLDWKKKYKFVVEENAILDYIAKEENHALPINPYTKYKKAMRPVKLYTASCTGVLVGIVLMILLCSIPSENEYVAMVKNSYPKNYPDITYGEAFDSYFSEPKWEYFKTSDGKEVVQFDGKCMYDNKEASLCFQFVIAEDHKTFSAEYLGINGEAQNRLTMGAALNAIFGGQATLQETTESVESVEQRVEVETEEEGTEPSDTAVDRDSSDTSLDVAAQPNEYDDVDVNHLDYRELYAAFIVELENEFPGNCTYSLYDINQDGRKDLLLSYGTCNADYENIIYTIDEDGAVSSTSPFYGLYTFYVAEDGNGLYEVRGNMGSEEVNRLTLQGNQAVEEPLWSKDIGDGAYYSNDNPLVSAMGSDLSLLDE